ncbi:MAG: alpha/beta hydrolase [Hyphomicrobiales bacterium]|nr:alpha/beta hydrolase [Hyphomicrobiales bacterium]
MTALMVDLLATLAVVGGLVTFSVLAARRIERAVPPQGRFLDLDGERIHVLDKGAGRAIVLIHGLSGQMGNFTHSLVDRLAGDFRVVAFDRPGSGYSTRSPMGPAGVRAQAATLAKAIRAMKLERPVIVGHSLGGAVALAIALDDPDCAGALALIAPVTRPVTSPPTVFRGLVIRSPLIRLLVAWTLATPVSLIARRVALKLVFAPDTPPADFATAGGGLLGVRPTNVYAASSDMVAANDDLEALTRRYASIRVPVGILYGRGDRILDPGAQGQAMKGKIPGLDFELVDGGHMLPVTAPDTVAMFIRRIAKARAGTQSSFS